MGGVVNEASLVAAACGTPQCAVGKVSLVVLGEAVGGTELNVVVGGASPYVTSINAGWDGTSVSSAVGKAPVIVGIASLDVAVRRTSLAVAMHET